MKLQLMGQGAFFVSDFNGNGDAGVFGTEEFLLLLHDGADQVQIRKAIQENARPISHSLMGETSLPDWNDFPVFGGSPILDPNGRNRIGCFFKGFFGPTTVPNNGTLLLDPDAAGNHIVEGELGLIFSAGAVKAPVAYFACLELGQNGLVVEPGNLRPDDFVDSPSWKATRSSLAMGTTIIIPDENDFCYNPSADMRFLVWDANGTCIQNDETTIEEAYVHKNRLPMRYAQSINPPHSSIAHNGCMVASGAALLNQPGNLGPGYKVHFQIDGLGEVTANFANFE